MPPAATGHPRTHPGTATGRPSPVATWPPPVLDPDALADLPVPVQVVVVSALLPYEAAATSVRILKNTEALLGELVFHLNALRPAVVGVSQAYADGQFDQLFRTIGQIQQGTSAVALVWSPLTGLRDRLVPGQAAGAQPPPPRQYPSRPSGAFPPRASGYPPPLSSPPGSPPMTVPAAPPSTVEYVGRLGVALWDQAASLPGAGWLRRGPAPAADTEPLPTGPTPTGSVTGPTGPPGVEQHRVEQHRVEQHRVEQHRVEGWEEAEPEPAGGPSLFALAAPLVPGPVRRLFGG